MFLDATSYYLTTDYKHPKNKMKDRSREMSHIEKQFHLERTLIGVTASGWKSLIEIVRSFRLTYEKWHKFLNFYWIWMKNWMWMKNSITSSNDQWI